MKTELDKRKQLIDKLKDMDDTEIEKVNIFITGMNAGKRLCSSANSESSNAKQNRK